MTTKVEIRRGAYFDSIVLMQLQLALAEEPGVQDVGVMMGTDANKEVLTQGNLLPEEANEATAHDLLIVIRAEDTPAAEEALKAVEGFFARRKQQVDEQYLPQSLDAAIKMMPDAQWVLVSVPGQYAAGVARDALQYGRHVFLYSDNVPVEEELSLKREAAERGLLVMGPDCGTAIVNGTGLGFANRVRRGNIGLVAASGTGLQAVTVGIHRHGGGVSHALGTGGRDLSKEIGGLTTLQALVLLAHDDQTEVIVLISKPPSKEVADAILEEAEATGKPVVVDFVGYQPAAPERGNLLFATSFDEAAALAVARANWEHDRTSEIDAERLVEEPPFAASQRYLRGLFSGGTLAYEAQLLLAPYLPTIYSNVPLEAKGRLEPATVSRAHTIIDLGEDEFTVGHPHPMMDNQQRIRRLMQEAQDSEVAVLLLDVVLGDSAHPDPASELAPAIAQAKQQAMKDSRYLEAVVILVGTEEDPQGLARQRDQLEEAGALVTRDVGAAAELVGNTLLALPALQRGESERAVNRVDLRVLREPVTAINVGVELLAEGLRAQNANVLQVRWRPPAGGNERLASLLARMKQAN